MESKRKISAVLMLTCFFAMALNAIVVLTCDCTTCHTAHVTRTCNCGECFHVDGDLFFSQHCDCTHTHETTIRTGLIVESEHALKFMKIMVIELPRMLAGSVDVLSVNTHEALFVPLSVPLDEDQRTSTGGLRAPPVFA